MTLRVLLVAGALAMSSCAGPRAASTARSPSAPAVEPATRAIAPGTTFCNPLDIDYRFTSDSSGRRDAADPVITLFGDEYYLFASHSGGYWHSSDLRDWQLVEPRGLPLDDTGHVVFVRGGRLYYSVPSSRTLYTTEDPRAGEWRAVATPLAEGIPDSASSPSLPPGPFVAKRGGFVTTTGASSAFLDRHGNRWRVMTLGFDAGGRGERRLGIFPAGRDGTGPERIGSYLGDYPRFLPGVIAAPLDRDGTGWMLLSSGKAATASSTMDGHPATLAFDEEGSSWWSAATGGVGEWLAVDLGAIARVAALQINFADQDLHPAGRSEDDYQQYVIETSLDGTRWTTRIDESGSTRDHPHRYIQLDTARNARFLRITNIHAAAGGKFAIRELRVFGRSPAGAPAEPSGVSVRRSADGQSATIRWNASARASGYVVRFGIAPDRLHGSQQARAVTDATIDGLEPGTRYWFSVDAIGEGGVTRGRTTKEG